MPPSGWVIGCKGLRDPFRDAMFVGGREPKPSQWRFHGLLRGERGRGVRRIALKILKTLQVSTSSHLEWAMSCLFISDMWPLGAISGSVILGGCPWVAASLRGLCPIRHTRVEAIEYASRQQRSVG